MEYRPVELNGAHNSSFKAAKKGGRNSTGVEVLLLMTESFVARLLKLSSEE